MGIVFSLAPFPNIFFYGCCCCFVTAISHRVFYYVQTWNRYETFTTCEHLYAFRYCSLSLSHTRSFARSCVEISINAHSHLPLALCAHALAVIMLYVRNNIVSNEQQQHTFELSSVHIQWIVWHKWIYVCVYWFSSHLVQSN